MSDHLSNSELKRWAEVRADDAGRLSRELLALRARVAQLEVALREEREACARMSDRAASNAKYLGYEDASIEFGNLSAAIRARAAIKGMPQ